MASRVQFKFKSATTSETVLFDGTYISVGDLKREIVEKKGLSKDHAAELLLSEAQTGRGTHTRASAGGHPRVGVAAVCGSCRPPCNATAARAAHAHVVTRRVSFCFVALLPLRCLPRLWWRAEWTDDSELIQKNTSVIVRRVPGQRAKPLTAPADKPPG